MAKEYDVVIERDAEGTLIASVPRLPGCHTQAKSLDELKTELVTLKKEAFNLRFQSASGQLENTARVRYVRRTIARIQTILNQKVAQSA